MFFFSQLASTRSEGRFRDRLNRIPYAARDCGLICAVGVCLMPRRYTRSASLAFTAAVASFFSISAARGDDPFTAAIRPTDPKTPEEERRSFHVPPGFEVQLVAAEPDIQKPMNLAFDARGRLWVSG